MRTTATLAFLAAAILLSGSLGLPFQEASATAGPAAPATSPSQDLLDRGLATADRVQDAAALLASAPLADALEQVAGAAAPAPEPASQTLAEALDRLAVAAGFPAGAGQPAGFAALDPDLQLHLARMVDGVRESHRLLDLAFAGMPAEDRDFLRANVLRLDQAGATPEEQQDLARLEELVRLVDPSLLRAAGVALLRATEGLPSAVPADLSASTAVAAAAAPWPQFCGSFGSSLVDLTGMVEVGLAGPNGYLTERVLLVDLEGNDCYENHPASVGPGSSPPLPVSALVDLGGNDRYFTANVHPTPQMRVTTWGHGVGIGGVGMLVDRWGNDVYHAELDNEPVSCGHYGGVSHWQRVYAEGVGILGVGALVDTGGDDDYIATNRNDLDHSQPCEFGRVYTFAQGVGARLGLGVLADDTGDDEYHAHAFSQGRQHNTAHVQAQGAAAARGLGLLLDKEGQDTYAARTGAHTGNLAGTGEGNFAHTFAQASLYGTNEPRNEMPARLQKTNEVLGDMQAQACRAAEIRAPATVVPGAVSESLVVGAPCDVQAVALLVDVLGIDRYSASADASDRDRGCTWGAWAMVSAQGSAPAKGAAALVDLSVDEFNGFFADADANAAGCRELGVRAGTFGQGFGGAILWDHWDAPPFDPLLLTDVAVGLLLRGGACDVSPVTYKPGNPIVDTSTTPPSVDLGSVNIQFDQGDPCEEWWSSDTYAADADATNDQSGLAWAQTYVQGSGNGLVGYTLPGLPVATREFHAFGIGINGDAFGDDVFEADADVDSLLPATLDALVVAQGAGRGAVGVLLNVGDHDAYDAATTQNNAPGPVLAQADGQNIVITFSACVPVTGTCVTVTQPIGVGILVDVFGQDAYTQPCPSNGAPLAVPPAIWGNAIPQLSSCLLNNNGLTSSGILLGVDANP